MDLNVYYQKIRAQEAAIAEAFPIVVSHATGDGGKDGHRTEVPKRLAAKMIVEGMARLATVEETLTFRDAQNAAVALAKQLAAAATMQVAVLASSELDKLRAAAPTKE